MSSPMEKFCIPISNFVTLILTYECIDTELYR